MQRSYTSVITQSKKTALEETWKLIFAWVIFKMVWAFVNAVATLGGNGRGANIRGLGTGHTIMTYLRYKHCTMSYIVVYKYHRCPNVHLITFVAALWKTHTVDTEIVINITSTHLNTEKTK